MIYRKNMQELADMAEGGRKLAQVLALLLEKAKPGVTLLEIELEAQKLIKAAGGTPSFQTVADYEWATCLCVNDVVVHGIPTLYKLAPEDILTIDVGILYHGWHTDTAWTKIIGRAHRLASQEDAKELESFLQIGQLALKRAISVAQVGNHIGHISQAIEETIVPAGYSIVKTLVGHGVGRELHEEPQVPGYLRGKIENTLKLEEGLTIAIEIIYAMGSGEVVYDNDDGWTIASRDGSLTAVFEQTIAVTPFGPRVLTQA